MCMTVGCGILWEEGVTAQQLKCDCGYGYWDMFQERYIPHAGRKTDKDGRALPLKVEEKNTKSKTNPSEFESCMRAQFISHCLNCVIKRRFDDGDRAARFDESKLARGFAELLEISRGDFESRGSSAFTQTLQALLPSHVRGESNPRPVLRQASAHRTTDLRQSDPITATVRLGTKMEEPQLYSDKPGDRPDDSRSHRGPRHTAASASYAVSDTLYGSSPRRSTDQKQRPATALRELEMVPSKSRHGGRGTLDRQAGDADDDEDDNDDENDDNESDNNEDEDEEEAEEDDDDDDDDAGNYRVDREDDHGRSMFLPENGISREILEYHQKRKTFGEWGRISRTRENGQDGFSISYAKDSRTLDSRQIKRIIEESRVFKKEEARKQQVKNQRPPR